MPVTAVIGAQWGDEGKGKITDYLAQNMDVVLRANGADNAGHTIINEYGEFKLHLVPSGIFNPEVISIIGSGVAVNPKILIKEIVELHSRGVETKNLKISSRAHLIMPWHILLDELQEKSSKENEIGTTRRGVGPVFSDKTARFGLRVGDFLQKENFKKRFQTLYKMKEILLRKVYKFKDLASCEEILRQYLEYRETLLSYVDIVESEILVWEALEENKNILLEGAQGVLLDVDFGTYPYVTSSNCTLAGLCQGSGIPPTKINEVIGVVKAYTTRVGSKNQPFPTEMPENLAKTLRERAREYGATTGRPRRIGWLDGYFLQFSAKLNGFTSLAVTRLDNLAGIEILKIANPFLEKSPETKAGWLENKPRQYTRLFGWDKDISNCESFEELPFIAQFYVKFIEILTNVPVKYVSIGPERNQTLIRAQNLKP